MLEHIFSNITDIRVFDIFYVKYSDREPVDINDIMKSLEYPEAMYIQVENSIKHLVKEKILEQIYVKVEGWGGCRTCLYTDKLHLPRVGEHKKHVPFGIRHSNFPYYRLLDNEITKHLFLACFNSSLETANDIQKEIEKEDKHE
jgi:hypothetical protein